MRKRDEMNWTPESAFQGQLSGLSVISGGQLFTETSGSGLGTCQLKKCGCSLWCFLFPRSTLPIMSLLSSNGGISVDASICGRVQPNARLFTSGLSYWAGFLHVTLEWIVHTQLNESRPALSGARRLNGEVESWNSPGTPVYLVRGARRNLVPSLYLSLI